jgi:hypothetical protein
MPIKGARTIAEYAIRRWLVCQGFAVEFFNVAVDGNKATVTDRNKESLVLVYDSDSGSVYIKE